VEKIIKYSLFLRQCKVYQPARSKKGRKEQKKKKKKKKKFDEKKLLSDMLWNDKYRASEEKTAKNDKNREKK
jgi:hypothetical protein